MPQHLPLAVAVVVAEDERYLIIQRAAEPFSGWWGPVTGRVEPGESLAAAARREAAEELGITVEPGEPFFVCPTKDGSHELHFLPARRIAGDPTPDSREVRAWAWCTLAECERIENFFENDLAALRRLAEQGP
jgi:ADP-ribose pyrophosphatase YjhB (NUDIX family)